VCTSSTASCKMEKIQTNIAVFNLNKKLQFFVCTIAQSCCHYVSFFTVLIRKKNILWIYFVGQGHKIYNPISTLIPSIIVYLFCLLASIKIKLAFYALIHIYFFSIKKFKNNIFLNQIKEISTILKKAW
jgi:hypothetical protein